MKAGRKVVLPACVVRKLEVDERVKSFNCGDADLNDFILYEAGAYQKALLAVTYVCETTDGREIAAYFSLANDRISLTDFQNNTMFNRFRKRLFVNRKRLKSYPATKICRLAVSGDLQRQHIGEMVVLFITTR